MAQPRAKTGGRWLLRSLASRLVLVSVVFIAVPILIYQQFRAADEDKQTLLLQSAQQQGQLIARALEPLLAKADASLLTRLGEELARFADENTRLKLLLRPKGVPGAQGFYYVGAAPQAPNANLTSSASACWNRASWPAWRIPAAATSRWRSGSRRHRARWRC